MSIWTFGDIILDDEDKYLLIKHSWHFKDSGHVRTRINSKSVYIHHIIMNSTKLIDHINRNPLDNRKSNLRFASKSTNAMNSKLSSNNTTGIKGVSFRKEVEKYEVYITINKKRISIGKYKTIKEAALKRIEAEKIYFKEFANFDLINEIINKYD